MTRGESLAFAVMLTGVIWLTARYIVWWFDADNLPRNYAGTTPALLLAANVLPFAALTLLEALRMLQLLVFWFFACFMSDAVPLAPPTRMRVAILTTIVPSKEPPESIEATLAAMSRIRYAGPLDLWVLDEEDDPRVHEMAQRYGIHHFTRHAIARYNQPGGPFAARMKSGNLNAWLDAHASRYDVMGQMDCDPVPEPGFLEETLGYFRDPDVGYVVAPQVYTRNAGVNWIARGADEQNFGFSSITQRGANRLGMPILIGSNHLVRTSMMRTIGGYVSHVVEDHITGMVAMATDNPATGRRWRGVYAHRVISRGEGPAPSENAEVWIFVDGRQCKAAHIEEAYDLPGAYDWWAQISPQECGAKNGSKMTFLVGARMDESVIFNNSKRESPQITFQALIQTDLAATGPRR